MSEEWLIIKIYRCDGDLESRSETYPTRFKCKEHAESRVAWLKEGNEPDFFVLNDGPHEPYDPSEDPEYDPTRDYRDCWDEDLFVIPESNYVL